MAAKAAPLHLAYFYRTDRTVVDGWYDRLTLACNEGGCISCPVRYERLRAEPQWRYIGHYPVTNTPLNVWREARAPRTS